MENLKKKIHDLEEELKSKQNSMLWVHRTYQDIIRDTSKVHEYVSSLLKTYDFDKHSKKIEKEVFGSIVTEPSKDNSKVESKPDNLENEEMEVEEPVQRTDPDMLQDGAKFQQYLSSLLTTLTNACSFVENLEKLRKQVSENHQERIRSMKDDYELKIEKMRKSSTSERSSQVDEISALKDKILEQLEFELNELRREKEKMTKQNSENGKEICKLKEDLEKKEAEISELKEKLVSKEKETFEKDRKIKDLGKEVVNNSKTIEPVITCDASTSTNSDNEITTEGEINPEAVVSDMSTNKNDSEVVEDSKATSNSGNGEITNETNDPKIVVSEMSLSVAKINPKVVIKDCCKKMDVQNDLSEDSFATHNSSSPGSPFSPMVLCNQSSPMVSDTSIDDTNDSSNHDDSLISDEDSSEPLSDSDLSSSSRKADVRLGRKRKRKF